MWRADSRINMPKLHSKPSMPAVAMSTARLRATEWRQVALPSSAQMSASSPSTSRQLLRVRLGRLERANSSSSAGATSLPSCVASTSLSSSMLCNSPSSPTQSTAVAAEKQPAPRPIAASARSKAQEAASIRSMRLSSLSTTGFQAMTRKSAHKKGSRIDLSSTRIRMEQYAPMTQRIRKPMRSRKSCPSVRAKVTSVVCTSRRLGASLQASQPEVPTSPQIPPPPLFQC
mmetsp:Transcript_142832/g.397884  ORF Transcript_142832/g.397884 Transcript_142832/m.397884 type:complete len:230 (+) Transcript_142832:1060-1749(+)